MADLSVLHIRASNFFGGPERQILTHLVRAREIGFPIGLCVFSGKGMNTDLGERARNLDLPVFFLHTDKKFDLKSIRRLKDIIHKHNVEIICSHGFKSDFYNYAVSRLIKVTKVGFVRGDTSENFKVYFYTVVDKFLIRRFDYLIALSKSQKRRLSGIGIQPDSISIVSNSIDVEEIEKAALTQEGDLNIDKEIIRTGSYIVTVGRFSPEKGHKVMVDAMVEIVQTHPWVKLIMIGEGKERPNLEAQIKQQRLEDHIIMPGFSKKALFYIKRASILVNPSYSEEMPNVVLEARALKTPIVATDVGGVSEIISSCEGGLLVPPGDPRSLAKAIRGLLHDNSFAKQLVENGFSDFRKRFHPDEQTRRLIKVYELSHRN